MELTNQLVCALPSWPELTGCGFWGTNYGYLATGAVIAVLAGFTGGLALSLTDRWDADSFVLVVVFALLGGFAWPLTLPVLGVLAATGLAYGSVKLTRRLIADYRYAQSAKLARIQQEQEALAPILKELDTEYP